MYTSKLLVIGTAAILCLIGLSSPSLACSNGTDSTREGEQHTTKMVVSLEDDSVASDLHQASEPGDTLANSGRFRHYKGRIIDTKDYIRARY
jgi:hypothetical protein